jgi:opacity protein-like surface antigen
VFSAGTGASDTSSAPFGLGGGTASGAGSASAFSKPPEGTSYTLPGFYGQGRRTLTSGVGLLAKPRYETTFSLSMGYDDNYQSAPGGGAPTLSSDGSFEVVQEPVQKGTPIFKEELVFLGGGPIGRRLVFVGFEKGSPGQIRPLFQTIPPIERKGSLLTQANVGFNMQIATRRSLFTLNASGGTIYYWDKDKDPFENNANISGAFLYKFTPRLQTTVQLNAAYITQPDFERINTPDRATRDPYYSTLARADVQYRLTPRFSLTGSLNYSGLRFTNTLEQTGDNNEVTAGIAANYLWNPRYTFVTEYRHTNVTYSNNSARDSSTEFLLLGADFRYSARLSGTVRVGGSMRSFAEGGSTATSPYFESSLNYQATSRSVLSWTNRFGFEEPSSPNEERLVLRTGLNYGYSFTPRLRGSLTGYILRQRSTFTDSSITSTEITFDSTAALNYAISQHFSLNLSYSFTDALTDFEESSYYRNRIFLGGEYTF